ncbi:LysR family transcriptional regulator [Cohaesibacter gelatinilyticus]|uniref:DNA-binding transcriptional regulator, LysR family n=1 Tax=Cohaesibacter gelatinilyticus TaxID=372072 RepID=A0A285PHL3_9HYPH|nr:LysR family transcriptional regulator [Cohaesibacter gelatinilyticus]SNZ20763.1 DNA-binding transcriptional regulator, LysR family [Cohaesibacter gelatinilyticus]HAT86429.1 LysR family transcriptional regulator [Hyphomicrobiales bacterium]
MIDELRALAIFAETVRQGSFRGAARKLDLAPSSVSYNIAELEKRLGTALLYRSTRKLSLTADGEALLQYALRMIAEAEKGLSNLQQSDGALKGALCVTATSVLMHAPINCILGEFAKVHSGLTLSVNYSDHRSDLLSDGVDVAFRAGKMEDSSLKSRKIGEIKRKLVCSPDYLAGREPPKSLDDLKDWAWIQLEMMPPKRPFLAMDGKRIEVSYDPVLTVNSVQAMTQFCLQGLGLSTPPDFLADEALVRGDLIELLPDYQTEPMPLYMVWPDVGVNLRATRALIDFVVERL